jgi:diguanylate cyclase (GGDEF)-like protein/PAS domain S-box-containing protein
MTDKFNINELNRMDLFFELFNNINDLVFLTKVINEHRFSYVLANSPGMELWGLSESAFGKPMDEVLPNEAYRIIEAKYNEAMDKKQPITYEDKIMLPESLIHLHKNYTPNQIVFWESTITPVYNQDGICTHLLAIVRDITDRKQKEIELKRINDRFELVWNSVAEAMYTFDKNEKFVSVNKSFETLLGWTEEEILSNPGISIIPAGSKDDLKDIIEKVKKGEVIPSHEVERVTKGGVIINFLASYSPIYNDNGDWDGGVAVYKDITERKQYEEKLKQLALHDPLTGLPNRIYFSERIKEEMNRANLTKRLLAVFTLDIDKFKEINDTMGHDIGDKVLKEFTQRVKSALRKDDTFARVGGDEFVILLPDLTDESNTVEVADRILQSVRCEMKVGSYSVRISTSIGISFYSDYKQEEKILLKQADIALYEAKKNGRNRYQIFSRNKGR